MNIQKKIKQATQFLISSLRNCHLYILNFAKSEKFIGEHDLKTKSMTSKAHGLESEKNFDI